MEEKVLVPLDSSPNVTAIPLIFTHEEFGKVRFYIDKHGILNINIEDAARGLGFIMRRMERVTKSRDKSCDKSCGGYTAIRWNTVNDYLETFGYNVKVGKGDFIPEYMFYRLAMKARSEAAQRFQDWIAREVIPGIRKNGYYAVDGTINEINALKSKIAALETENAELKFKLNVTEKAAFEATTALEQRGIMAIDPGVMLKRVYVFDIDDGTIKIGVTKNITNRMEYISSFKKSKILRHYETAFVDSKIAYAIEHACHLAFADRRVEGEYFSAPFAEAVAELKKYDPKIAESQNKIIENLALRKSESPNELTLREKVDALMVCARMSISTEPNETRNEVLRRLLNIIDT